ncbi:MAG TPA: tetratricopeptide repeat protein [Verrucomicrobiae bacterium]|nr:tetratricopeptide repeat protein [Verrucomicrobiae bacterium]
MKKPTSLKKIWILFGVATALIMLIAVSAVLLVTARLQQELLKKEPAYEPATLYNRAVDQTTKGDYQAAEASLEQALKQQDDATYKSQLAVVKYRLKKYEEAIVLYQKLIADGKDAAFGWNGIGNAYRDWADADAARADTYRAEAIKAYEQSIVLNRQYVAAYSNLALLYEAQEKYPEALAVLDRGIVATGAQELSQIRQRIATK